MTIVNASEFVKTHIRWMWQAPEDADEHAVAAETVAAMFALARAWLEIVALEVRIGLYDPETFSEADEEPARPFQLLRVHPPHPVRIERTYRAIESTTSVLDATTAMAWIDRALAEARVPETRFEPSLRELLLAGSRARLPDGPDRDVLQVSCYSGEIEVPVDHGWVTAPAYPPGVPDPVTIGFTNLDGTLRLVLEVFWSAWASAPEPVPSIRAALERLAARGWRADR